MVNSRSLLVTGFIFRSMYLSVPISQFIPPLSPYPLVTTSLFSMSVIQLLFCKKVDLYHFFFFFNIPHIGLLYVDRSLLFPLTNRTFCRRKKKFWDCVWGRILTKLIVVIISQYI